MSMQRMFGSISLIVAIVVFAVTDLVGQDETPVRKLYWDNGIHVKNASGSYSGKFGGRILFDFARFEQEQQLEDAFGVFRKGYEWRRLRVFHSGKFGNFKYKTSIEFAKEHVFIEDLYLELGKIPVVGNIRVGHFKEPFLLEMQSSSKHVVFMERAVTTMFSSGRNLGVMLHNRIGNSSIYYQLGLFSNGSFDVIGKTTHVGYNVIGRISGLVLKNEDRTSFIHAGIGFKQSWLDLGNLSFSSKPESHLGPKYISSGTFEDVKSLTALSAELVLQHRSWSLQSEMVNALAYFDGARKEFSPYYFPAVYTQLSYVITGEGRNYKNANSGFVQITPKKNVFEDGFGAWEVAVRYSYGSLDSQNIHGRVLKNTTIGINWYPNPIARISTNYIISHVDEMGVSNIWQMRFQVAI